MSGDPRRLTTDEQRERLHSARRAGGLCAACGRTLGDGESVYVEQFMLDRRWTPESYVGSHGSYALAPVGAECASPELLHRTEGVEPERCAGCWRGVYYSSANPARRQAICSRRCGSRAAAAKRSARMREALE
jgi:hypothetical protein